MRKKRQNQMPLMSHILGHAQSKGLEVISEIIDANPTISEHILQEPNKGNSEAQRAGAKGMSAEQVLRCIVVNAILDRDKAPADGRIAALVKRSAGLRRGKIRF
jgi:hypothetical protein